MSTTVRSQHLTEPDQAFSVTVGSGAVANTVTILDATTARLIFGAGGAPRLTLDTLISTNLTLKSLTGITSQSIFDVISTHVTEADQNISLFVGSGAPYPRRRLRIIRFYPLMRLAPDTRVTISGSE